MASPSLPLMTPSAHINTFQLPKTSTYAVRPLNKYHLSMLMMAYKYSVRRRRHLHLESNLSPHFLQRQIHAMASLKIHALLFAYALLAILLHPCLCQDIATSTMTSSRKFDGESKRSLFSLVAVNGGVIVVVVGACGAGKAIDQGIAYVLMLLALFVTYLVHWASSLVAVQLFGWRHLLNVL